MKKLIKEICRVVVAFCIFWYCKIVYRVKIIGKEKVPKEGALLFCGNHRTYLDPPLITVTAGRRMSFMAKEELKSILELKYDYDILNKSYMRSSLNTYIFMWNFNICKKGRC